jgi:hypothetical protein
MSRQKHLGERPTVIAKGQLQQQAENAEVTGTSGLNCSTSCARRRRAERPRSASALEGSPTDTSVGDHLSGPSVRFRSNQWPNRRSGFRAWALDAGSLAR